MCPTSPSLSAWRLLIPLFTSSSQLTMVLRRPISLLALSAALCATLLPASDAWIPHVITKGNKFFNSATGEEFRLKGMAYYPRPNDGELYEVDNYDWAADEHENVWGPHLKLMKELGVNTVRLYSVDPSKSHDKFMCACSEAGIYVLVGMAAPCENCAIIDEEPPACYPSELFARAQMIYNAFAVYDNVLGFSVGNENNLQMKHGSDGTVTAPCVKAFLRDVRRYAMSCLGSMRAVPIGLDIADIPPREQWLQYYDCTPDDEEFSRAEWVGFNPYVECDPIAHDTYNKSAGLRNLMAEYAATGYSRPIMFGEYGCNLGKNTVDGFENQRTFHDAKWMNEEKEMTDEIVGGNVFEFTTERNHVAGEVLTTKADPGKYGVGYFTPNNCDHDKTPCEFVPYPEFKNLQKAYTTTKPSSVTLKSFTPRRDEILKCPTAIKTDLPKTPDVKTLACSVRQPVCSGKKANSFEKDGKKAIALGDKLAPTNDTPEGDSPLQGGDGQSDQEKKNNGGVGGSSGNVSGGTSSGFRVQPPTSAATLVLAVGLVALVNM